MADAKIARLRWLARCAARFIWKPLLLRDLAAFSPVGVSAQERCTPRMLMFDLDIDLVQSRSGATGRVAAMVDDALVARWIRERLAPDRISLPGRIAESVRSERIRRRCVNVDASMPRR